jgi:hypothetical protein
MQQQIKTSQTSHHPATGGPHNDLSMNNMSNYNFEHIADAKKGVTSPLTAKNINNYLSKG